MKSEQIALRDTQQFTTLFLDYLAGKEDLKPFFHLPPSPESFKIQIEHKAFDSARRQKLVATLNAQYQGVETSAAVKENLQLLEKDNSFTITTGHQLNIFTGPLYFIYKIVTVINTCRELKKRYPEYNFIPLYWMASEDHDFEEISQFNLFGKEYKWETDQKGAVGGFSPQGLADILDQLPERVPLFDEAYTQNSTLSGAVRQYVNKLFGEWGVITLDANAAPLKASFAEIIKSDLLENTANSLVEGSSAKLEAAGYKAQVFPREINFFFMKEGLRERIVREGKGFKVLNTEIFFNEDDITAELQNHPEHFSPNVIMRPLFQEFILPNLAYVGGPAEVAYWLQLKSMFDYYQVDFPILLPRNFALVISKSNQNKLEKTGLHPRELFADTHDLKSKIIQEIGEHEISITEEMEEISRLYGIVKEKARAVDRSLEGFVGAEAAKAHKSLESIQKRIKKAEEKKHETQLNQIESLKEKLFPGKGLQERKDNFLNFYLNDPSFIGRLAEKFDPFSFTFNILSYDE